MVSFFNPNSKKRLVIGCIHIAITISFFNSNVSFATDYQFAAIEKLVEQDVATIIMPKIYRELDLNIDITRLPAKRAQLEASSGIKDGEILRIWSYGSAFPSMIRVPTPYYQLQTMAFSKKIHGIDIHSKNDLKKYRIVKVSGVKHTIDITKGMNNIIDVDNTEAMMKYIQNDRADVALTNTIDGIIALKKLGFTNIEPSSSVLASQNLYHYIHKSHQHLVTKVDTVIKNMKKSGKLQTLIQKAEKRVIGYFLLLE